MEAWVSPPCRSQEIAHLLGGVDRYNEQNLAILERYLHEQAENGTYDCLANLAILKLYQFNPDIVPAYDADEAFTPFLVLLLALANEPFGVDYSLCVAMLGERMTGVSDIQPGYVQLRELADLLAHRRFPAVWDKVNSDAFSPLSATLDVVPRFVSTLRLSIARGAVAPLFRDVPRPLLLAWLGVEAEDAQALGELTELLGWRASGDHDGFAIPSNEENTPKASSLREPLTVARFAKVLERSAIKPMR